jgi:DNA-binding MarR family transcriptional regulator
MSGDGCSQFASPRELYELLRRVRPLHRALIRIIEAELGDSGLTRPMRAVLEQLDEQGPQTVPQLARALAVRRQFVQRVVNDLIAAGLAERQPNVAHRRSWMIAPTRAGTERFAEIQAREWTQLERVAGDLDRDRVRKTTELLAQLARAAERAATHPSAEPAANDGNPRLLD